MKTENRLDSVKLGFPRRDLLYASRYVGASGRQLAGFASSYDLQGGAFSERGKTIFGVDQAA